MLPDTYNAFIFVYTSIMTFLQIIMLSKILQLRNECKCVSKSILYVFTTLYTILATCVGSFILYKIFVKKLTKKDMRIALTLNIFSIAFVAFVYIYIQYIEKKKECACNDVSNMIVLLQIVSHLKDLILKYGIYLLLSFLIMLLLLHFTR